MSKEDSHKSRKSATRSAVGLAKYDLAIAERRRAVGSTNVQLDKDKSNRSSRNKLLVDPIYPPTQLEDPSI